MSDTYIRTINDYHLELAMLSDAVSHLLSEIDGPEWMTSSAHIFQARFAHLVETFPFPPQAHLGE